MHSLILICPVLIVGACLFFLFRFLRHNRKISPVSFAVRICADGLFNLCLESNVMQKFNLVVGFVILSFFGLSKEALAAAVDGAISVVSSDTNVLKVTPLADGTHRIDLVGVGNATLTVSGDADLGDGVAPITTVFNYEVYDGAHEADHFGAKIVQEGQPADDTAANTAAQAGVAQSGTGDPTVTIG